MSLQFGPLIGLFLLVITVFIFISCTRLESERRVKSNCMAYLEEKYKKSFKVESFSRYFHGGHFAYETTLFMYPADNPSLLFPVDYSAKERRVRRDEYKLKLWDYQLKSEMAEYLNSYYELFEMETFFRKNADASIYSNDMPYYATYSEMIKEIEQPAVVLEIYIEGNPSADDRMLEGIAKLSRFIAQKELTRYSFEIYFVGKEYFSGGKSLLKEGKIKEFDLLFNKELLFKFSHEDKVPSEDELAPLLTTYRDSSLIVQNRAQYEEALALAESGRVQEANALYEQIVMSVSKYRFRHSTPMQTAYSVHAAFALAEHYAKVGESAKAASYYQFIVDRLKYENGRMENAKHYKAALEKLGIK